MSKKLKYVRTGSLNNINYIFNKVIECLPNNFPKVSLVIHLTVEDLQKYYTDTEGEEPKEHLPFAFCDGNTYTVHVPLEMSNETKYDIYWYLLHEVGHLYAHNRYGAEDPRWTDYKTAESYANRFANRWVKKLKGGAKI